jgi:hypothetical protein
MNVLDLFVFPNMSKQHCILAWECGGIHVLKENEIWTAVNDVCYQLPSYEIASGFVQAHWTAKSDQS